MPERSKGLHSSCNVFALMGSNPIRSISFLCGFVSHASNLWLHLLCACSHVLFILYKSHASLFPAVSCRGDGRSEPLNFEATPSRAHYVLRSHLLTVHYAAR